MPLPFLSPTPSSFYQVAVIGATGNVGRRILSLLAERNFPVQKVYALASRASLGAEISFGEKEFLRVQALEDFDFKGVDIAFFSAGSAVSKKYAPQAARAGALVIDNTSYFRMEPDVPLIVPEVNPQKLSSLPKRKIIANPNCVAIPLAVALKPLHEKARITRVVLSTYQSVSGAGRKAMDELFQQTRGVLMNMEVPPKEFSKRIAFNVIPHIGEFEKDGMTGEETKIRNEIRKILDPKIKVMATCARVPVFIGHSISATIELADPMTVEEAREALEGAPGVWVMDRPQANLYATPEESVQEERVIVSRIRKDPTVPHGLSVWIVSDNLDKGAALNAIQIAERLFTPHEDQRRRSEEAL